MKRKGEGSINGSNAMNPTISSQAVPWLFSQIVRFIAETILIVFVTKQTFSCFVV